MRSTGGGSFPMVHVRLMPELCDTESELHLNHLTQEKYAPYKTADILTVKTKIYTLLTVKNIPQLI